MAEFKLEKFRYTWKGAWAANTAYKRDDVVRVNGKSYVCIVTHTSNSVFATDLNAIVPNSSPPQPAPRWTVMTSSRSFAGNWTTGVAYNLDDIVFYNGSLYLCNESHIAAQFHNDFSKWTLFAEGIQYLNNWTSGTSYAPGAVVKYGGRAYKCVRQHLSTSIFEDDQSIYWELFYNGREYKGDWQPNTTYKRNDVVRYGASLYTCDFPHTSNSSGLQEGNFAVLAPGAQFQDAWNNSALYQQGDIVRYGGYLYYAIAQSIGYEPDEYPSTWTLLANGYNFRGPWTVFDYYKIGDVVLRGGRLYLAKVDIEPGEIDGSTMDYLQDGVWELLNPGKIFSGNWTADRTYNVGEVVYHLGSAYVCNFAHIADPENSPGYDDTYFYWDLLAQAGRLGGLHDRGDLLTYGLSREAVGNDSTLGPRRIPIGSEGAVLSVNDNMEAFWRNYSQISTVVWVSSDGSDLTGIGSFNGPFKTIRYAAEHVEDNFDPYTPVTIRIKTGSYQEIGPISVPAGTAIVGDELRSVTIEANPPLAEYQNDFANVVNLVQHISTFIFNLISGNLIQASPGNTITQVRDVFPTNQATADRIVELITDYRNYIDYRLNDTEILPVSTGSNVETTIVERRNAVIALENNAEWIKEELYRFLLATNPGVSFSEERIKSDANALFRAIRRDLSYSGNYATLLAARRYVNAVVGSQNDDMFFLRDVTGLRNCTLTGLVGNLNPPGVFDLYQRPTGGSFCSLDPGWGPDDDRTWILTRSPYIQGVTTIGQGCVGQKIDGSLHNGGNKSFTSNDFTQVLSDGIGAWVLNNARAELVSVFTYYCQVGYLATEGGIIRATNGNNSYGSWGSIADGADPNETPQPVTVFNRNNEAQVEIAFAGGASDEIYAFEYSNAGENYTTASATVIGAGSDAAVEFDDFRDNAIFEARLINTTGSGSEGGSGFIARQGFAQITENSTSTIRLSATEITQLESEILGMRIIIISGDGTGQYGIVNGYNQASKDVAVIKESDGQPGWDHIIDGYPINSSLNSTAQYRIEPRITIDAPGFVPVAYNLNNARTFGDLVWGGTTAVYSGLSLQTGTGETFDFEPINAIVRITRAGQTYSVELTNPGGGYAVGDTTTISGTELGGSTPANDLTITVTAVTEDSTNSISTFTISGTARANRLVATADPNFALYSDNGTTWSTVTTAFVGNPRKLVAGNNRFIGIVPGEDRIQFSFDGQTWSERSLPLSDVWSDATYGGGKFVIISSNSDTVLYSTDGINWNTTAIPEDTQSDSTLDSTVAQWTKVVYGKGKFVAISQNDLSTATSEDGITWIRHDEALAEAGNSTKLWVGFAYGRNRYLALTYEGETQYSFDGITWYLGGSATPVTTGWLNLKYNQGLFFAIAEGNTSQVTTSEAGLIWTNNTLDGSANYTAFTYAGIEGTERWIVLGSGATIGAVQHIRTGARARFRPTLNQGRFSTVRIVDPGSGYDTGNMSNYSITITSPGFESEAEIDLRTGNGVLAQPTFIDRGTGYRSSSSVITISGDGFADIIPEASELTLAGVAVVPGPGVQIRISSIPEESTEDPNDLKLFTGVEITDLGDDGSGNGTRLVQFTISPSLRNEYNLAHGIAATLRVNYSQCRITGHDFLDIGTGNFEETNYPDIYASGAFFTASQENEVLESNGGRVFYTSTDQDGNFRAGELFGVDQATGIVTISAQFFELDGLSELALGGVRLGGSGAVVREFSTDPNFTEDSNNVIPTQRAIATFLANRLSVGGENLELNRITAGRVRAGGESNVIENTTGSYLFINSPVDFSGQDANAKATAIQGTIIQQMLLLRTFDDTVQ